MSHREEVSRLILDDGFQNWILNLHERNLKRANVHSFCLDFSSALLANCFHQTSVLDKLEQNPLMLNEILRRLLALLKQPVSTSVLIHLLICLSYLSKERFGQSLEDVGFVDRISEFVEWFTARNATSEPTDGAANNSQTQGL